MVSGLRAVHVLTVLTKSYNMVKLISHFVSGPQFGFQLYVYGHLCTLDIATYMSFRPIKVLQHF